MEKPRQHLSDGEEVNLAEQLKALGHPVRLQILQSLGEKNNCCCNDFCASIPLAQSTISQHLKILNRAGIIDYRPVGNCSYYSLNATVLTNTINTLSKLGKISGMPITCDLFDGVNQQLHSKKKSDQKMDNQ